MAITAKQVKEIMMESSSPQNIKVIKPGTSDEKVNFSELSVSGGIVNCTVLEKTFISITVLLGITERIKKLINTKTRVAIE